MYPNLSKTLLHKFNHETYSTLTWAITVWSVITLRHRGIVIILSATMPELFRMSPPKSMLPHRRLYVLISVIAYIYLTIPFTRKGD